MDPLHRQASPQPSRSAKHHQPADRKRRYRKIRKEILTFTKGNYDPFTKLLFDVLGSFAEFERNILRERQREGIEKAKAAGKYAHGKGGRKKSVDRAKVRTLREQGVSFRKIAEQLGCSLSSVQRVIYGEAQ